MALIAASENDHPLWHLLRALDALDRSLSRASTFEPARFNRALVLERLYLVSDANAAWQQFISSSKSPEWISEAQQHRSALAQYFLPDSRPDAQRERMAFIRVAGRWGRAVLQGDQELADSLLDVASSIADSTKAIGGDQSAVHALPSMRSARLARASSRRIATAFASLDDGVAYHDADDPVNCIESLRHNGHGTDRLLSPLGRWSKFYLAACEANSSKFSVAEHRLERLNSVTPADEPGLHGKIAWVRGVIAVRRGEYEAAAVLYQKAGNWFNIAREPLNSGAVAYLMTECLALSGRHEESETDSYRGLRELASYRDSHYLHNLLIQVRADARAGGLRFAAMEIANEALAVDAQLHVPDALAYSRWVHAQSLVDLGDTAGAIHDLDAAQVANHTANAHASVRVDADAAISRASLLRRAFPRTAESLAVAALDAYQRAHAINALPSALRTAALIERDNGRFDQAQSYLDSAIKTISNRSGYFASVEARASFYETVEDAYDDAIGLAVDRGYARRAFSLLEDERYAVWQGGSNNIVHEAMTIDAVAKTVPQASVVIVYAVLPSRLIVWVVRRGGWQSRTVAVSRDSLSALVEGTGEELRRGFNEGGAATRLYNALVQPITDLIRGASEIIIIPDRELTSVSFAALRPDGHSRYLVELAPIRTMPTASSLVANRHQVRTPPSSILSVAANSGGGDSTLELLPNAEDEARTVSRMYDHGVVLSGVRASRGAVLSGLGRHDAFHFAGHAVVDEANPERSYLALDGHDRNASRVEAREIAKLRLSNTRLVVLSACRTMSARASRSGAIGGLAYSFLRAGASAVVSTLWNVADNGASNLILSFHRQVRDGTPPAIALQRAQIASLTSSDIELRRPRTWAAYVYTGP